MGKGTMIKIIVKELPFAGHSDQENGLILYWKGYSQSESNISILRHIEENSEKYRDAYLTFIYDLGESVYKNKSFIEHWQVSQDFSLWWMSLLAEKSPYKSYRILDCIRMLALEDIVKNHKFEVLEYHSSDKALAETIRDMCSRMNKRFVWTKIKPIKKTLGLKKLYLSLPHAFQGLIYAFRHIITRWKFRKNNFPKWHEGAKTAFFVSNLFNLDIKKAKNSIFHARQWEEFPDFLRKNGIKNNLIHHFLYSPDIPNTRAASDLIEQLNKNTEGFSHLVLDSFLDYKILYRVLVKWIKLLFVSMKLNNLEAHFCPRSSNVSLWKLLKEDWESSLVGSTSMANLIWFELFNKTMKLIPQQSMCFYLCENQGWERAFLYAWKKFQGEMTIAVPHTVVRFWDVRYFVDKRTFVDRKKISMPLPDKIAANGKVAYDSLVYSGVPQNLLIEVEALRFQYLSKFSNQKKKEVKNEEIRILILGDFTTESTVRMLEIMKAVMVKSNDKISCTLKPHPACKLKAQDYQGIDLSNEPLTNVLNNFDIAFASNTTASSLDAYIAGLSVMVYLDDNDFNYSPMKGVRDVVFVSDSKDFINGIDFFKKNSQEFDCGKYFWIDTKMTKWSHFLKEEGMF